MDVRGVGMQRMERQGSSLGKPEIHCRGVRGENERVSSSENGVDGQDASTPPTHGRLKIRCAREQRGTGDPHATAQEGQCHTRLTVRQWQRQT